MTHRQSGLERVSPVNRDGHAIGLDIGGTAVRAAVLTPRVVDGRPSVSLQGLGRVGLPRGAVVNGVVREPALVTNALKALWQQNRIDCRNVIVGVTSQQVVVRKVDLPNLPPAERAQALPFQARDIIALPIERAILDFIRIGPVDEGSNTVPGLLVAAPREPVSVTVRAVEQAGLRVARVDLAAFAALRAVADEDLPVEAVVDIGAHLTNIVIHIQGVPMMVRTVARGGDELTTQIASRMSIDTDAAELAKRTVGLADDDSESSRMIRDILRPLLSELRSSLSAFEQANPDAIIERVSLTGGGAAMPGLADELSRIGDVPVDVVDAMTHVGNHRAQHGSGDEALRTVSAVAVGLAMGVAA